jgi:hypothetical protein
VLRERPAGAATGRLTVEALSLQELVVLITQAANAAATDSTDRRAPTTTGTATATATASQGEQR